MKGLLVLLISISFFEVAHADSNLLLRCTDMPIDEYPILEVVQTDNGYRKTILKQDESDNGVIVESYASNSSTLTKPVFSVFTLKGKSYQFVNYYLDFPAASDTWDLIRIGQTMKDGEKVNYPNAHNMTTFSSGKKGISSIFYDMNCN